MISQTYFCFYTVLYSVYVFINVYIYMDMDMYMYKYLCMYMYACLLSNMYMYMYSVMYMYTYLLFFTSADGPPITIERALLEVEEEEEVEEGEEGEGEVEGEDIDEDREAPIMPQSILENDTSDDYIKANIERIAALAAAAETESVKMNSDLYAYGNSDRKEVDVKSVVEGVVGGGVSGVGAGTGVGGAGGGEEKDDVQDTFTKLLKATMDQQSLAAESTGNVILCFQLLLVSV
jgi:hypothetical protein